jgi:hypothetical protein
MSKTADMIGGKPIAIWSQPYSGVNANNPLVAFYDIHGRKREVIFFYFVPDTTLDVYKYSIHNRGLGGYLGLIVSVSKIFIDLFNAYTQFLR